MCAFFSSRTVPSCVFSLSTSSPSPAAGPAPQVQPCVPPQAPLTPWLVARVPAVHLDPQIHSSGPQTPVWETGAAQARPAPSLPPRLARWQLHRPGAQASAWGGSQRHVRSSTKSCGLHLQNIVRASAFSPPPRFCPATVVV